MRREVDTSYLLRKATPMKMALSCAGHPSYIRSLAYASTTTYGCPVIESTRSQRDIPVQVLPPIIPIPK